MLQQVLVPCSLLRLALLSRTPLTLFYVHFFSLVASNSLRMVVIRAMDAAMLSPKEEY